MDHNVAQRKKGVSGRRQFRDGRAAFRAVRAVLGKGRSASDDSGWSSYGKPVAYQSFDLQVRPGEQDQEVAGHEASHFIVEANFASKTGKEDVWTHTTLTSDLWVLEDKPFTFAPFATVGAYEDPRLTVALNERLSDLGMVVRVETRHDRHYEKDDGTEVGYRYEGAHIAWDTDFESTQVPDMSLPLASEATADALRTELQANADAACESVMAGEVPTFAKELLNEEQQEGFFSYLERRCGERAARK